MPRTAADRMRVLRKRRARGFAVLPIEVDEVDLPEKLVAAGYLSADQVDDRAAVARAASRLLSSIEVADLHPRR